MPRKFIMLKITHSNQKDYNTNDMFSSCMTIINALWEKITMENHVSLFVQQESSKETQKFNIQVRTWSLRTWTS